MPRYKFLCHACKKTFSKILALVDYDEGRSAALIVGARKSSSTDPPSPP